MNRPSEPTGDPVLEQLASLGVDHEVMAGDPALADTAAFCEAYGIALEDSANAILVAGKARPDERQPFALCLVLATHRLDVNGMVRQRLGSRKASFASAEETAELTGMQIGGVTPFGLPTSVPIWVDGAVLARDRVVVGGGSRDRKILLPPGGLLRLPGSAAGAALARPAPPPARWSTRASRAHPAGASSTRRRTVSCRPRAASRSTASVSTKLNGSSRVPSVSGSAIRPSSAGPQANSARTNFIAASSNWARASKALRTWVASWSVSTHRVWTEHTRDAWILRG